MSDSEPTSTESAQESAPDLPSAAESSQRTRVHWIVNVVVSVCVLGASLFGYTLLGERQRPKRAKPPNSDVTVITSEPLRLHQGSVEIKANGVVVPLREIRLATEVAGRIIEISDNMRAGNRVSKDEVLVRLDPAEYQLEVNQLQAQQKQETADRNVGLSIIA